MMESFDELYFSLVEMLCVGLMWVVPVEIL